MVSNYSLQLQLQLSVTGFLGKYSWEIQNQNVLWIDEKNDSTQIGFSLYQNRLVTG